MVADGRAEGRRRRGRWSRALRGWCDVGRPVLGVEQYAGKNFGGRRRDVRRKGGRITGENMEVGVACGGKWCGVRRAGGKEDGGWRRCSMVVRSVAVLGGRAGGFPRFSCGCSYCILFYFFFIFLFFTKIYPQQTSHRRAVNRPSRMSLRWGE